MVINYEFGGDDYTPGEDFEFAVDYDQRVEAIADFTVDNFLSHLMHKYKLSSEQYARLKKSRKSLIEAFTFFCNELDLISEEVEESCKEIIAEYWEKEAHEQWKESKY